MRLSNSARNEFITKATKSIFKEDEKNFTEFLKKKTKELTDIFTSSEYYKKGREIYDVSKGYCLPYTTLKFNHGFHFFDDYSTEYLRSGKMSERLVKMYENRESLHALIVISLSYDEYMEVPPFVRPIDTAYHHVAILHDMYLILSDSYIKMFGVEENEGKFTVKFPNELGINKYFNENEEDFKNRYIAIVNEIVDTEVKFFEKVIEVEAKIDKIAYSVNTTNQLLSILPNAEKFISDENKNTVSENVCEEINDLLA